MKKNYVGLSVFIQYFDETDVITSSQAWDGISDDNKPIGETNWLD